MKHLYEFNFWKKKGLILPDTVKNPIDPFGEEDWDEGVSENELMRRKNKKILEGARFDIVKVKYDDEYSHNGYRYHIATPPNWYTYSIAVHKMSVTFIMDIETFDTRTLYEKSEYRVYEINDEDKALILDDEIWITNLFLSNLEWFKSWKYSDIKDKINIMNL